MSETTTRPTTIVVDKPTEAEFIQHVKQFCGFTVCRKETEALFGCIQMWPTGSVSTVLFDSRLKVEFSWSWTNIKTESNGWIFGPRVTISRIV